MVNTNFSQDGTLGINITQADTTAQFVLGTNTSGNEGAVYVYCQANGAMALGDGSVALLDPSFQATLISTSNSNTTFAQAVSICKTILADNEFGWFQIYGTANIFGLASAVKNVALNTTATAGHLDDDATAGAEVVAGLILTVTVGGGGAAAVEGHLNFPTVGVTLS